MKFDHAFISTSWGCCAVDGRCLPFLIPFRDVKKFAEDGVRERPWSDKNVGCDRRWRVLPNATQPCVIVLENEFDSH